MTQTQLKESAWTAVPDLTRVEAQLLDELGRTVATNEVNDGDVDVAGPGGSSIIQCRYSVDGEWQVRVGECVGVVGTGTRSWVVQPKVPLNHLLYLMRLGGSLPRDSRVPTGVQADHDLFELLMSWLLSAVEGIFRRDLARGYERKTEASTYVRGSLRTTDAMRDLLRGRTRLVCSFEEFVTDIPLNRVLKAAVAKGLRSGALSADQAWRARRTLARFEHVGDLRPNDMAVTVDRTSFHYGSAVSLARQVLSGRYLSLRLGTTRAWCFLWRTPGPVERGIRAVLRAALQPVPVTNASASFDGMRFTPDLVIGDRAIGDIKYSFDESNWRRSDVYQLLAFTVSHARREGILVNFSNTPRPVRSGRVADVSLARVVWPTSLSPGASAEFVGDLVRVWYSRIEGLGRDPDVRVQLL